MKARVFTLPKESKIENHSKLKLNIRKHVKPTSPIYGYAIQRVEEIYSNPIFERLAAKFANSWQYYSSTCSLLGTSGSIQYTIKPLYLHVSKTELFFESERDCNISGFRTDTISQ